MTATIADVTAPPFPDQVRRYQMRVRKRNGDLMDVNCDEDF